VLIVLAWTGLRARKTDHVTIEQLRSRLDNVSTGSLAPSEDARQMCRAIRCLYPAAQVGVDFVVADHGEGPFIQEWALLTKKPDDEQLRVAIQECKATTETSRYREERALTYPSIGDQMDAMYKARNGDTADLEKIDAKIAEIKAQFPIPDPC
jgi:hypothetical protein